MRRNPIVVLVLPVVALLILPIGIGCGSGDEGLKIVIEENIPEKPEEAAPPQVGGPEGLPPTPEVQIPGPTPMTGSAGETPEIAGTPATTAPPVEPAPPGPALKTPIVDIVQIVEADPEIKKLINEVPVVMTVAARPAGVLWGVRLSFKEAVLFDLNVDDNTKTISSRRPYLMNIKKVRDGLEDRVGKLYRESMKRKVISYSAALKTALMDDGAPRLDWASPVKITIGFTRFDDPPKAEVVFAPGDGGPLVIVSMDAVTGRVTGVREETKVR